LLILERPAGAIATKAAKNKCLAQSNKSRTRREATKKRIHNEAVSTGLSLLPEDDSTKP